MPQLPQPKEDQKKEEQDKNCQQNPTFPECKAQQQTQSLESCSLFGTCPENAVTRQDATKSSALDQIKSWASSLFGSKQSMENFQYDPNAFSNLSPETRSVTSGDKPAGESVAPGGASNVQSFSDQTFGASQLSRSQQPQNTQSQSSKPVCRFQAFGFCLF